MLRAVHCMLRAACRMRVAIRDAQHARQSMQATVRRADCGPRRHRRTQAHTMPRAPQGRACDSSAFDCIALQFDFGAIGRGRHLVEADEGEDRPQVPKVHTHIAARHRLHSLPSLLALQ